MDRKEKAAGLLFLLGEERCREIVSYLDSDEVEKLKSAAAPRGDSSVLRELKAFSAENRKFTWHNVLDNTPFEKERNSMDFLENIDADRLFAALEGESAVIAAVVLKYAGKEKSREVLALYPEDMRKEILRLLFSAGKTDPKALEAVAQSLKKKLI